MITMEQLFTEVGNSIKAWAGEALKEAQDEHEALALLNEIVYEQVEFVAAPWRVSVNDLLNLALVTPELATTPVTGASPEDALRENLKEFIHEYAVDMKDEIFDDWLLERGK